MNSETEKLGRFSRAVYKLADDEADKLMSEAYADYDREIQQAGNDGLALSYEKIKEQVREIDKTYVQMLAKGELDAKRRVLLHREELSQKVFDKAAVLLERYLHSKDYEDYLVRVAFLAAEKFPDSQGEILVRSEDLPLLERLSDKLPKGYTLSCDKDIALGGLSVRFREHNLILDYTFDAAFEREKKNFFSSPALKLD